MSLFQPSLPLPGVTRPGAKTPVGLQVVLSLFPGIGLLDRGFEAEGFCVVRGPDLLWGGDVRVFHPPAGRFDGVIGGSPCQDFSSARRDEPTGYGQMMIDEFTRVVGEAEPDWWLLENVPGVPDVKIPGYSWQRLDVYANEFGLKQRRLRHVQFGSRLGMVLVLKRPRRAVGSLEPAAMASDTDTPWERFVELQGLPEGFDIPPFTIGAKREAVGNGVPVPMAKALAQAVADMQPSGSVKLCDCGCGRPVSEAATYAKGACRMRMLRRRRDGVSLGDR